MRTIVSEATASYVASARIPSNSQRFGQFFVATMDGMREKGLHSHQVELETLGTKHTHVGRYLGLNWGASRKI